MNFKDNHMNTYTVRFWNNNNFSCGVVGIRSRTESGAIRNAKNWFRNQRFEDNRLYTKYRKIVESDQYHVEAILEVSR